MRKTTRSKYNGRVVVASGLRTIGFQLGELVKACEHHKFGGKRLVAKIQKLAGDVALIQAEAAKVPVTQDEKIVAKIKRKKESSSARSSH